jgi:hypothetical protein
MLGGSNNKTLKLKKGGISARVRGKLRAIIWKDKQDVHILENMCMPPEEGNFNDENTGNLKNLPVLMTTVSIWAVNKEDRMANSYTISQRIWKWIKNIFSTL